MMHRRSMSCLAAALLLAAIAPAHGGLPAMRAEAVVSASSPTYLTQAPGDDTRLFVIERGGLVRVLVGNAFLETPFLDLTTNVAAFIDGGLIGIAFHPDYETNGYFYVNYTTPAPGPAFLGTVIARYTVSGDPNVADPASEQIVLTIDQPAPQHNGGWIGFGPFDGFLYVPMGDGGFQGDAFTRAQDTSLLLGKVLRLDVDGDDFPGDTDRNYAIPPDNPFVGAAGADEIWAVGVRNPFRASFDRLNGNLWVGDVGASSFEEVDVINAASIPPLNFGWGCMEAFTCFGAACMCGDPTLVDPEFAYGHASGTAVAMGSVYRGCAIPGLQGTAFVADYGNGRIWALDQVDGDATGVTEVTDTLQPFKGLTVNHVVAISEDNQGELYIVSLDGFISKIVPDVPIVPDPCDPCPADIDGGGDVGFSDLSALLAAWGPCPGCAADIDGNDDVGFSDLSVLLANWGPCL